MRGYCGRHFFAVKNVLGEPFSGVPKGKKTQNLHKSLVSRRGERLTHFHPDSVVEMSPSSPFVSKGNYLQILRLMFKYTKDKSSKY